MKTERRQELNTNVLADWLGQRITAIAPFGRAIIGFVFIGVVLAFVFFFLDAQNRTSREANWTAYFSATTAEDLIGVVDEHEENVVDIWARQAAADLYLAEGGEFLFDNRRGDPLEKAKENYQIVAEKATDDTLKRRALFGLAQACEALNELDEAKKKYQEIKDNNSWSDTVVWELADRRLKNLEDESTLEFYQWFFAQGPRSPLQEPMSGGGGQPPFGELPDSPGVDFNFDGSSEFDDTALPDDEDLLFSDSTGDEEPADEKNPDSGDEAGSPESAADAVDSEAADSETSDTSGEESATDTQDAAVNPESTPTEP